MQLIPQSRPRFDSITVRMVLVALLGLAMLIPLALVSGIVDERHGLYQDVLRDIASSWGGRQTLSAPILVVPYIERFVNQEQVRDDEGQVKTISKTTRHAKQRRSTPRSGSPMGLVISREEYFWLVDEITCFSHTVHQPFTP